MIGVVHLVRARNGTVPLRRFVDSYLAHPAGVDHRRIAILKGFDRREEARRSLEILAEIGDVDVVEVPDDLLDVSAYTVTAERLGPDIEDVCFLNSFSRICADDWLEHLAKALALPEVGLAGATGSWMSRRSFVLQRLGLPTAYRSVLPGRRELGRLLSSGESKASRGDEGSPARSLLAVPTDVWGYGSFPVPHVRTNAFIISRRVFVGFAAQSIRRKAVAHRFESGRAGLSAQVRAGGLALAVVDAEGGVHAVERWPESETFWWGEQRRLLVADNQTDRYLQASAESRAALSALAWGDRSSVAAEQDR